MEPSRLCKDSFHSCKFQQPITFQATRASLWQPSPTSHSTKVKLENLLPTITLSDRFKHNISKLWNAQGHPGKLYIKASRNHYKFQELALDSTTLLPKPSSSEFCIRVRTQSNSTRPLKKIQKKINSIEEFEVLDTCDLCIVAVELGDMKCIKFTLLAPVVSFKIQELSQIKLVSTPLSTKLTNREKPAMRFMTGFITMDQKRRVMPMSNKEVKRFKYPLVGIWTAGVQEEISLSPLLWTSCIRFLELNIGIEKISPGPEKSTFLLVNFCPKPHFYEISCERPKWVEIHQPFSPSLTTVDFYSFDPIEALQKKSLTASTSSSDSKSSRLASQIESFSAEKLIIHQNSMLKSLEKQISQLQHALSDSNLKNAETNTTNPFTPESHTELQLNRKHLNSSKIEKHSKLNPLRHSHDVRMPRIGSDVTFKVPKIVYQLDENSLE